MNTAPEKPLKVVSCSVLRPELEAMQARGLIPGCPLRFIDSALHMQPELLQERLAVAVRQEQDAGFRVLLAFGDCSTDMAALESSGGTVRTPCRNCGEMLLGRERCKALVKQGAFLLFPEWAERWREILTHFPGMDDATTREMMRDMHSRFVYLDTGCRPVPHGELKACSEYFNIPHEVINVNTDNLQKLVREAAEMPAAAVAGGEPEPAPDRGAAAVMMLDVISAVLEQPGDVAGTASRLSQKIRELTGTRAVILAVPGPEQKGGQDGHRVLSVTPQRHASLAESGPVRRLIGESFGMDKACISRCPSGPAGEEEHPGREFCPCLVMPLRSGGESIGSIVALGFLDEGLLGPVLEIQDILSSVVAVVLKNALLAERQQQVKKDLEAEIVERRQAEEVIQKIGERERVLLNTTVEGIYGIDLEGRCTFANASCLKILGYTDVEQLIGKNMHELIHHSFADGRRMPVEQCNIYRAYREGRMVHVDNEVLWRADGTCFQAEYWSKPKFLDDRVAGAVVAFLDITERKRSEEEREALITQLQKALGEVKTLSGLLPICANCKKVRDDRGYWDKIEVYLSKHASVDFTHGICPECIRKLYPDYSPKE